MARATTLRLAAAADPLIETAQPCEIRHIADRAGFEALETAWTALFERAGRADQLFQSFNFLWHWVDHFLEPGMELAIITGWSGRRLVMVWPLVRSRSCGLIRLGWMGEPVSQYGDVLVEPGPLAEARLSQGWQALRGLGADIAVLRKIRRTAPAARLLQSFGTPTASMAAPYMDLGGAKSFDEIQRRFSPKARSARRRLLRRLEELGTIQLTDHKRGDEAQGLVKAAIALKKTALDRRGRYAPALDNPAMEAFFHAVMRDSRHPVDAVADSLSCNGVPIGVALSFSCKGECFGHILAHDVAFNKQGAGVILAEQTFRSALARGLTRFDMLAPNDAFKSQWASGVVDVDDWGVALTWRGALFMRLWLGGLRAAVKHWADRAPPWLGTAVWGIVRRARALRAATRAH